VWWSVSAKMGHYASPLTHTNLWSERAVFSDFYRHIQGILSYDRPQVTSAVFVIARGSSVVAGTSPILVAFAVGVAKPI